MKQVALTHEDISSLLRDAKGLNELYKKEGYNPNSSFVINGKNPGDVALLVVELIQRRRYGLITRVVCKKSSSEAEVYLQGAVAIDDFNILIPQGDIRFTIPIDDRVGDGASVAYACCIAVEKNIQKYGNAFNFNTHDTMHAKGNIERYLHH